MKTENIRKKRETARTYSTCIATSNTSSAIIILFVAACSFAPLAVLFVFVSFVGLFLSCVSACDLFSFDLLQVQRHDLKKRKRSHTHT